MIRKFVPKIFPIKNPLIFERSSFFVWCCHHEKESARWWIIFVFLVMFRKWDCIERKNLPEFRRGLEFFSFTPKDLSEWRGNLLRDDSTCEHEVNIWVMFCKSKKFLRKQFYWHNKTFCYKNNMIRLWETGIYFPRIAFSLIDDILLRTKKHIEGLRKHSDTPAIREQWHKSQNTWVNFCESPLQEWDLVPFVEPLWFRARRLNQF